MAAILRYGLKPAQPTAPHSFFHMGSNDLFGTVESDRYPTITSAEPDRHRAYLDGGQSFGVDGVSDLIEDKAAYRSDISPAKGVGNSDMDDGLSCQNNHDSQEVDNESGIMLSYDNINPHEPRRKRRKISPDICLVTQDEQSQGVESAKAGMQMHVMPLPIASRNQSDELLTKELKLSPSDKLHSSDFANSETNPSEQRTPRKNRGQKKLVCEDGPGVRSVNLEIETSPTRTNITTPRKKRLSLHANGKLLSSPANEIHSAPKSLDVHDKKSSSARHYEMKNGKFVQSLKVLLRYGADEPSRKEMGGRIDVILSKPTSMPLSGNQGMISKTHPFFLGKSKPKTRSGDTGSIKGDNTDNESDLASRPHEPVAWKDMKFVKQKPTFFKFLEAARVIWPPLSLHHIGRESRDSDYPIIISETSSKAKMKSRLVQLTDIENILHQYTQNLRANWKMSQSIAIPQRKVLSGAIVAEHMPGVNNVRPQHDAITSAHSTLIHGSSAFDRGECAGPNIWPLQYSPSRCSEVLQPSASVLFQWLQGLAIHDVKSGVDNNGGSKKQRGPPKRKRRKPKDALDDFIVNSDDDTEDGGKALKTAILITGPHGCGKTASVYAAAKELGFEVFEIHPGMRRSAKDILDKVGDMAHNHLVQHGADLSRSSSLAPSDVDATISSDTASRQPAVTNFLGVKSVSHQKNTESHVSRRSKREQKQSLILFEEVDLLFDDDRGFWHSVQNLIKNSKRPVVLTCNDPSVIPMDDLGLYDILTYVPVQEELAADYMSNVAAAEGHLIDRNAILSLYTTKHHDLRASLTELNFWCQMTVGSQQGGLDWMGQSLTDSPRIDDNGKRLRTFSQDTFHLSLDLMPQIILDNEPAIRFAQDTLDLPATEWCDFAPSAVIDSTITSGAVKQDMLSVSTMIEARSVMDLLDDYAAPILASVTAELCQTSVLAPDRSTIASRYIAQRNVKEMSARKAFSGAFEPLMVEKPTFPPSQGRLAPSIETYMSNTATEIAPYVRSIVRFDQQCERYREETPGSQGKTRNTRAARAAAEGGDKASTRTERWFPKGLDFDSILQTGHDWPTWYEK